MRPLFRPSLIQLLRFCVASICLAWPWAVWGQAITATIPVASAPEGVAVNTVTNIIYVANYLSGTVTVIDGATNTTTTVQAALHPVALAVNEVTNKIYVANRGFGGPFGNNDPGSVTVIDGATNSPTTVIDPNANGPDAVSVNSVTNKIYVSNFWSGNITVIDGATNATTTVTDPNANGLAAYAVAVNQITNKIYIANNSINGLVSTPGNITVIDGATNVTTTVTDPNAFSPFAVAVNSATNKVYVANEGNYPAANHGNVTVIDGATNTVTTLTDPNALAPQAVAVNETTNKIYVANANDSAVSGNGVVTEIDGATNTISAIRDLNASFPNAVAVDSATNEIYVANQGCFQDDSCKNPGSVTIINGATNSATTLIDPNAKNPWDLAINPVTNTIFVSNTSSDNITVIAGGGTSTSHLLTVLLAGGGSGAVNSVPAGINCTPSCSAGFPAGSMVNLMAVPATGSELSSWGTTCPGTGACNVTMGTDQFVTATFSVGPPPDFSLTAESTSLNVPAGGQKTDVITIAPLNGPFGNAVQLSCVVTGSTPLATCQFSSNSVTPGANPATSMLTITAPSQLARLTRTGGPTGSYLFAVCLLLPGLPLICLSRAVSRRDAMLRRFLIVCGLACLIGLTGAGCGGGSGSGQQTQPLNYNVTVTATSQGIQHATQITVTVP